MRPPAVVAMTWRHALFLHWRADANALRALLPPGLELDVADGSAWIGIVAFTIVAARPRGLPPALGARPFGEINVRTYVRAGAIPGVWFFSLDAASRFAVAGGRNALHLPYYDARVTTAWDDASCAYASDRADTRPPASAANARFAARARIGDGPSAARAGTLAHFLVERYAFYTVARGRILRGDVAHVPWPLHDAHAQIERNDLLHAAGISCTADEEAPLAHASSGVETLARPLRTVPRAATTTGMDRFR